MFDFIVAWFLLSIPIAFLIGRFIELGLGENYDSKK